MGEYAEYGTEKAVGLVPETDGTFRLPTTADVDASGASRYAGGKTAVVATVTASGDTTVHTPAVGKRIRVFWVYAIADPDDGVTPLIKVKLGTTEIYRCYAVAHWEVFTGGVNEALVVNLGGASNVAFTAHITEVD